MSTDATTGATPVLSTVAPIVGTPPAKAGEFQLAAVVTAAFTLLGVLLASFRPSYMPAFTRTVPWAESLVVIGATLAHAIKDYGVTRALGYERSALAYSAKQGVSVLTSDVPSLAPVVATLEAKLNAYEPLLKELYAARQAASAPAAPTA